MEVEYASVEVEVSLTTVCQVIYIKMISSFLFHISWLILSLISSFFLERIHICFNRHCRLKLFLFNSL